MINGFSGYRQYSYISNVISIFPDFQPIAWRRDRALRKGTVVAVCDSQLPCLGSSRGLDKIGTCWDAEGQGSIVRACFRLIAVVLQLTLQFISFHIFTWFYSEYLVMVGHMYNSWHGLKIGCWWCCARPPHGRQDSSSKTGVPIAPGALRESGLCALGAMPWSSGGFFLRIFHGKDLEKNWLGMGTTWEKPGKVPWQLHDGRCVMKYVSENGVYHGIPPITATSKWW